MLRVIILRIWTIFYKINKSRIMGHDLSIIFELHESQFKFSTTEKYQNNNIMSPQCEKI